MIRVLIDECVPLSILELLKAHDACVDHIKTLFFDSLKNGEVYRLALKDYSLFITNDRHFRRQDIYPVTKSLGIIHLRVNPSYPELQVSAMKNLLSRISMEDLVGKLTIVWKDNFTLKAM